MNFRHWSMSEARGATLIRLVKPSVAMTVALIFATLALTGCQSEDSQQSSGEPEAAVEESAAPSREATEAADEGSASETRRAMDEAGGTGEDTDSASDESDSSDDSAQIQARVDPGLPEYERVSGVSGNLSSIGSDTLNNLMTLWAEEFAKIYPNVNIQIQGAGSSTAPPALTEGTANFGPMSRMMRSSEIEEFEDRFGYPPTPVGTSIDAIAVMVNKDNPLACMSIPQVDAVFSVGRRCGAANDITRWGQLGLEGAWDNRDFTIYSRNAVSGTYGFFKDVALCGGDFKPSINEQPGSASVVQGVTESLNGIGYSGIGYMTSGIKPLALDPDGSGNCVEPTADTAVSGEYPLARLLYVYVNKPPNQPLAPLEREFFRLVLSRQGQEVVVRDGYIPLPASVAERIRNELDL